LELITVVALNHSSEAKESISRAVRAGWDDQTIIHTVSLAGYWTMINRIVNSLGITATPEYYEQIGSRLAAEALQIAASFNHEHKENKRS
jgi:hypothetical protein